MVAGLIGAALFGSQLLAPSNLTLVHQAGPALANTEPVPPTLTPAFEFGADSHAATSQQKQQLGAAPILSKVEALHPRTQQQQQQQHEQQPKQLGTAAAAPPTSQEASAASKIGAGAAIANENKPPALTAVEGKPRKSAAPAPVSVEGRRAAAAAEVEAAAATAGGDAPGDPTAKGTGEASHLAAPALMRHESRVVEETHQAFDHGTPNLPANEPVVQVEGSSWAWVSPFAPSTLVFGTRHTTSADSTPSWRHRASAFLESQRPRALLVGTTLQLLACLVSACGLVIQRAVATGGCQSENIWNLVGLALVLFSALPDALSYLLAPQSLLAQLGCLEPLLVALLAMWALPDDAESLTRTKFIMTVLSIVGAAGCAASAPSGSVLLLAPEAEEGALEARIATYLRLAMPLVLFLTFQEQREQRAPHSLPRWSRGLLLPSLAGVSLAVQRMAMAALGVALQVRADHGDDSVASLLMNRSVIMLGLLLAASSTSCLVFVWRGARQLPPHVFVPLYCAISAALQLLQSVFVLREYRDEPTSKAFYSMAACAVSLGGVAMLHLEYTTNLPDERPKVRSSTTGLLVRLL